LEEIDFFKLVTNNLVSVVIAYMLLKFFIEIMRKKLLNNSQIEEQNLKKNIEIYNSLKALNTKVDQNKTKIEDSADKTTGILVKISDSQVKLCTLMESLDKRINGKFKK